MPAAAVIPASVASIKVAAVKRLAVECQYRVLDGGRCLALPCRPYKPPDSRTEIVVWLREFICTPRVLCCSLALTAASP